MIEIIWNMIQEFIISVLMMFKKNFRHIMSLMFLVFIILFICIAKSKTEIISLIISFYLVTEFLKHVSRVAEKNKNKLPVSKIRYTKIDEEGNIFIEKHNWPMAVCYLYYVEEFIKQNIKFIFILFCFMLTFSNTVYAKEDVLKNISEDDKILLQQIALAEAENEGIGGMTFVMQTVLNRVESENFPDTIYEVITQKGQFDGYEKSINKEVTENSSKALSLLNVLQNRGQLYFENNNGKSNTWHNKNLTKCFEHLNHTFYF